MEFHTSSTMASIPAREISCIESKLTPVIVSVLMMTRNHEAYLTQAVASVVSQETDFIFEILIGEDYSADSTKDIAIQLQKRFPDLVRVVVADKNVGITQNFLRLLNRARGEFIAFLEGDDYWIDSKKLQMQVDLMRNRPDFAWCGAKTLNRIQWLDEKSEYEIEDILRRYIIHTSTVMFRTNVCHTYPCFPDRVCWETMLFGYLSQKGGCGFINKALSYYRRHEGGLWHNADRMLRIEMGWDCIDALDEYFQGKYTTQLIDRENWIYDMDFGMPQNGRFWKGWKQSIQVFKLIAPRLVTRSPSGFARLILKLLCQLLVYPIHRVRGKLGLGVKLRSTARYFSHKQK